VQAAGRCVDKDIPSIAKQKRRREDLPPVREFIPLVMPFEDSVGNFGYFLKKMENNRKP
jgi:hypothetical protein